MGLLTSQLSPGERSKATHVADPEGGVVTDAEARAAIVALRDVLVARGDMNEAE